MDAIFWNCNISVGARGNICFFWFFPTSIWQRINSHTKSQTGIVAILFSYFRVGVGYTWYHYISLMLVAGAHNKSTIQRSSKRRRDVCQERNSFERKWKNFPPFGRRILWASSSLAEKKTRMEVEDMICSQLLYKSLLFSHCWK